MPRTAKPKPAAPTAERKKLAGNGKGEVAKRPAHRPSEYTPERAAAICEQLTLGRSVNSILSAPGMPDRMTLVRWLAANEDFRLKYAHAREIGFDVFAEITLSEATDVPAEMTQSARLKWDARRWHLSKMLPKRYGDRTTTEHVGADGAPIGVQAAVANLNLTPPQIAQGVRELLVTSAARMNLPALPASATDQQRMDAIMSSGQPLAPELYRALHGDGDDD